MQLVFKLLWFCSQYFLKVGLFESRSRWDPFINLGCDFYSLSKLKKNSSYNLHATKWQNIYPNYLFISPSLPPSFSPLLLSLFFFQLIGRNQGVRHVKSSAFCVLLTQRCDLCDIISTFFFPDPSIFCIFVRFRLEILETWSDSSSVFLARNHKWWQIHIEFALTDWNAIYYKGKGREYFYC